MLKRLKERRKALVPLVATVIAEVVLLATGVQLDVVGLTGLVGVVVAALVHEVPNAPAA